MTEYITLAEVQAILRLKSRATASQYIKANEIPFSRVNQRMLVKAEPFFKHLDSVTSFEERSA